MSRANQLVVDGCERARRALEPTVAAEVTAEFAEQLARASWWRRMQLRYTIRREVAARIERLASERALY